jgi:hypothetical protein
MKNFLTGAAKSLAVPPASLSAIAVSRALRMKTGAANGKNAGFPEPSWGTGKPCWPGGHGQTQERLDVLQSQVENMIQSKHFSRVNGREFRAPPADAAGAAGGAD